MGLKLSYFVSSLGSGLGEASVAAAGPLEKKKGRKKEGRRRFDFRLLRVRFSFGCKPVEKYIAS